MLEEKEIEDFENVLADKRHKEIVGVLRDLLKEAKDSTASDVVKDLPYKLEGIVASFSGKLAEICKPESPEITVNNDYKEVVSSIEKLGESIKAAIVSEIKQLTEKINETPDKEVIIVSRNERTGDIEKMIIKNK